MATRIRVEKPIELNRRHFLTGIAASAIATSVPWPTRAIGRPSTERVAGLRLSRSTLSRAASESGRYFGAAARIDQIDAEPKLRSVYVENCSYISPEIHLKWNCIEPSKGRFHFKPMDDLASFAELNDIKIHGHALIWDQSTPDWAKNEIRDRADWRLLTTYFASVMSRYRDHVEQWDVVNEPIDVNSRADGLRETTFLRAFGPSYVERALYDANEIAPNARLIINDDIELTTRGWVGIDQDFTSLAKTGHQPDLTKFFPAIQVNLA